MTALRFFPSIRKCNIGDVLRGVTGTSAQEAVVVWGVVGARGEDTGIEDAVVVEGVTGTASPVTPIHFPLMGFSGM